MLLDNKFGGHLSKYLGVCKKIQKEYILRTILNFSFNLLNSIFWKRKGKKKKEKVEIDWK